MVGIFLNIFQISKRCNFVKEKLLDLEVAEKNLNRNIDSKAQLELFLGVANDVKT